MSTPIQSTTIEDVARQSSAIVEEVERAVVGKHDLLQMVMVSILAGGHILLEDFPGIGKTLIARSFARVLGLDFKRIQFTPDLLPGDITGGWIFNRAQERFELRRGPVFANIVLADEINRASPKTQSALLEAMQEKQVTLEGDTQPLPDPFLVIATQNPIEYEGTFPLPEAQLDRFMVKLSVGYPSPYEEAEILRRRKERRQEEVQLNSQANAQEVLALAAAVETVHVHADLERYMAALVGATRQDRRVAVGASPRGSLAFLKLSRAWAAMQGRDYVIPDDIKQFATAVLSHRLILQPEHWMAIHVAQDVIDDVFARIPVPVID